ncbi:hypothetical protein ACFXKC_18065 [Streptomyces sp. NPDC059340]|uniref:hypothetical protein n=1 Tax=Streptomyces sp. NPDC059340 TaxID=3346806 RepID=UPI003689EE2C
MTSTDTAHQPLTDQQLDEIEARANAATPGPWGVYESGYVIEIAADLEETGHDYRARRGIARLDEEPLDNDPTHKGWMAEEDWAQVQADAAFIAAMSPETAKALVAEVRRLRADAAAELLPAWEAVYEPGNVSDYLIGYANDEAPAKAAAEAWMRSQAEVTGRLEWLPEEQLATGRYDQWFELIERHDDGIDTGPGITVRRRTPAPVAAVVSSADGTPGNTR